MRETIIVGFVLLVGTVAATVPAPASGALEDPPVACPVDHPVHPPIEITEDVGPQGFILAREPVTGQPIYRPGSGVIGGNGTAEDPFIIDGWCLKPTDDTIRFGIPQAALTIDDTSAHVVVRDVVVDGQIVPRVIPGQPSWTDIEQGSPGFKVSGAEHVSLVDNRIEDLQTSAIIIEHAHDVRSAGNVAEGVWIESTTGLVVEDNQIHASPEGDGGLFPDKSDALVALDSPGAVVAGNDVRSSSDDGIVLKESEGAIVEDNFVKSNLRFGLVIKSSDGVVLRDNTLQREFFKVARSNGVLIEGNTQLGSSMFLLELEQATVANNTFRDNAQGIDVEDSTSVRIVDNRLEDNTVGILLFEIYGQPIVNTTIARNVITGNEIGIRFGPGDHRDNGVTQNNIYANAQAGLEVADGETVDATGNWWGCVAGPDDPACDRVAGDAVYDPWLTSPNPEAGLGS